MTSKSEICTLFLFILCWPAKYCLESKPCNFDVKITQTLLNEGFHRNISYEIVFSSEDNEEPLYMDCIVGLDQVLPAGVFVNPDELGELKRLKKVTAVPKNRVNVELPAEQSAASNVFLVGGVRAGRARLWLPVHARYHHARSGGGWARNEIGPPELYVRCGHPRLQGCARAPSPAVSYLCSDTPADQCSWKVVPYTVLTDTLVWEVPVGNTDHYTLVSLGTATVVVVGSLYLLKTIHQYKLQAKKRR